MAKSCSVYITQNDFEGCLERFETSLNRWKSHWFETLTIIYNNSKEWAEKYILDPITQTVKKLTEKIISVCSFGNIDFIGCKPIETDGIEQFYILELLDNNNNLIWSKVGTTTRRTMKRMREHLDYYKKNDVKKINVLRLWDCGEDPAECYESFFRAYYIKKYPGTFNKNDRFTKVKFDLNEADMLFNKWKTGEIVTAQVTIFFCA